MDSADGWIMNYADVAPAFVASNKGYDVWLGNNRGNKYSLGHTTLTTKDKEYWEFAFEEMGDLDLPAFLEYITAITGFEKHAYVGHSQGTSQLFYALSHNESYYASKISIFVALGPVMQITHCESQLLDFVMLHDTLLIDTCELFGIYDLFPANWFITGAMDLICGNIPGLCEIAISLVADENTDEDDESRS